MSDEGAKILAAAIEKLALALANGIHVHNHAPMQVSSAQLMAPTPFTTYPTQNFGPATSQG